MKYILSGGGTGGHIYPALAICSELKRRNLDNEILYVGKKGSLEEELVKKEGIAFKAIDIEGLPRKKLNKQTVLTFVALLKGLRQCEKIIKEFKPDVVIGTGGYVCAPIVIKAQQKNIPTVVQEQNAYPGKTNKFLSKKANLVALNFEEAKKYFDSENLFITGNPIRSDFNHIDKDMSRRELGLKENEQFVLSFGGSGGQESTNEAVIDIIKEGFDIDFKFTHITGKAHYDNFMKSLDGFEIPENINILDYSYEIPKLLMASDLVIASSSAMTLAEISAVGVASILIPKAYTVGNHQYYNALSYEDKKASKMISEDVLSGRVLYENIKDILVNDKERETMANNSKLLGNISAVKHLVDRIEKLNEQ